MNRMNLIRVKHLPYHVTTRTFNQQFFYIQLVLVWEMVKDSLREAHHLHPVNLVSFVLMGNHYHMLLFTPNENLDFFM